MKRVWNSDSFMTVLQEGRRIIRATLYNYRMYGARFIWHKAVQKVTHRHSYQSLAKQKLFTDQELMEQRMHSFPQKIRFSIIAPLYNTSERFLREMIESVLAQTYFDWELCLADGSDSEHDEVETICREFARQDSRIHYKKLDRNLGISGNSNVCLEMASGDYIALFDHDDLLHPAALHEVMRAICECGADFIYTDEKLFRYSIEEPFCPHFKPVFAPDTLRVNNYICHLTVFKRDLLDVAGLFDPACDGSQDHDLVLRLTENAKQIVHIPEVLYYWRSHAGSVADDVNAKPYVFQAGIHAVEKHLERFGLQGSVTTVRPGLTVYRIQYRVKGTPTVSILIPDNGHLDDLKKCLNSIFQKTSWQYYEIVIVENNSEPQEVFAYYDTLQKEHDNVRIVSWKGDFNHSAVNNFGAHHCVGEYLLLLDSDTEVITPDWIQEMLMYAQRNDIGAVGTKLYYPNGRIQSGGICLSRSGVAGHYFSGSYKENMGYSYSLIYAQNLSAVSGACMMLRRDVWEEVHGFDEELSVAFNDVDLCMRIRKKGYLIVWTPFAELFHNNSRSRGYLETAKEEQRFRSEKFFFEERWNKELKSGDPYYNPNFLDSSCDFSVDTVLRRHAPR